MDPVGKGDADIDNDGDTDSSDKYLHKRRKAISKAMKRESVELDEISQGLKDRYKKKASKDKDLADSGAKKARDRLAGSSDGDEWRKRDEKSAKSREDRSKRRERGLSMANKKG